MEPVRLSYRSPARTVPRDFMGVLLFFFVIGSMTLFGEGQLKAIGLVLAGAYALFFLKERKGIPLELVMFCIWVLWAAAGFVNSVDQEIFRTIYILVIAIGVMAFAISGITAKRGNLNANFLALIIGGVILFGSGISLDGLDSINAVRDQERMHGFTANSNTFGFDLMISSAAVLYFWRGKISRRKRILLILLMLLLTAGIVMSGSRKAFLGEAVLIILWLWLCYRKELLKKSGVIVTLIVFALVMVLVIDYMLAHSYMGERFKRDFVEDPITQKKQEYSRIAFYKEGWEMIKEYPLFGVGMGNFRALSPYGLESHSDYVEVATSTGIVGFFLYFSIYVLLWRRIDRIQKRAVDEATRHNTGLIKATVITILLVATGRPGMTDQVTWVFLSSVIGYTWAIEKKLKYLPALKRSRRLPG